MAVAGGMLIIALICWDQYAELLELLNGPQSKHHYNVWPTEQGCCQICWYNVC